MVVSDIIEGWVECHLLRTKPGFPSGARHPWGGGRKESGPECGFAAVRMWIPPGFGLESLPLRRLARIFCACVFACLCVK